MAAKQVIKMKAGAAALAIVLVAALWGCERGTGLEKGNWNPEVWEELDMLLREEGKQGEKYDPACRPYAVFDYDNTTVINDIAQTLLVYQIENRAFKISPERFFDVITEGIPELGQDYGKGYTVEEMARELSRDYSVLCSFGDDLEGMRKTDEYLDFRAKLWYFSASTMSLGPEGGVFGCIWIACLLDGMSPEEVAALTRASVDHWLSLKTMWREEWTSPDGRVTVRIPKGLGLTNEMKNLYKALRDNGFDVYICSASPEWVVEAMATDPRYGLGLDTASVFGIRFLPYADGTLHAVGASGYAQPYREGKTECIKRYIAPRHGGRSPSLVAGDSSGDYSMLTSFEDCRIGLIINCLPSGRVASLMDSTAVIGTRYLVQGRDPSALVFLPGRESRKVPLRGK